MFFDLGGPLAAAANAAIEWLVVHWGNGFEAASNAVLTMLLAIEGVLRGAPPFLVLILVAALAFAAFRRPLPTLILTFLLWLIGCLGLWEQAMQTIAIVLVSVALVIIIGVPLGVLAGKSIKARSVLLPVLDLMQTIPSFAYLIPAAMLFGLGKVPAVLATMVYALPPLIRLTDLGLRQVDREVVQASRAFGATRLQILRGVELPLSLPSIMQGLNQSIMAALAMVVIASMIGARGIGETVLLGLQRNDAGTGLVGGLAIVILAIVLDRISQGFGRRLQAHRS